MRAALLKKLDTMLEEIERGHGWCQITIECKDGIPDLLRKMTTEKLHTMENTRGQNYRR
jgi:hypothetical protein